jgi:nitrous oxidase accessory protein NosD
MKRAFVFVLVGVLIAAVVLVGFFVLQTGNQFSGTIDSDTTWSGTVNLTGNVTVNSGVRLTIQPGTIVNFNSSALQINGTLVAMGNGNQKITLNGGFGGMIIFTASSTPWNEQAGSGSIMDNCVSSCYIISRGASPKFTNCMLNASPQNSRVMLVDGGAPIIVNNQITGNLHPVTYGYGGESGIMFGSDNNATVTGNTIQKCMDGIAISALIKTFTGTMTIQQNLIMGNINGVFFGSPQKVVFENNTVTENWLGFRVTGYSNQSVFANNNIYGNTNRTVGLEASQWPTDMNVPNNWWGTTDTNAISQLIHDSKIDPQLGTVNFAPFLQTQSSNAPKP